MKDPGSPGSVKGVGTPLRSYAATQLAEDAKAAKRFHFSTAVTLVSVSFVSYVLSIYYLCPGSHPELQEAFYTEVPATIYMWPMVAFATALLLNIISWAVERRDTKRQLCFLACYISGVAFIYEFLGWQRVAPIFPNGTGRPISLMRYLMWLHATPAMLYAMSMISDFSPRRLAGTIAVDVVMIVTAIAGELIPTWHRWVFNAVSCAVFPALFHELWCMYSSALSEATDEAAKTSLRALRALTVTFWSVFPVVWAVIQLDWVDARGEEALWACADIGGKIFFSSTLLHGNFMTIEHRRLVAMRIVEEANRVRVIHELRQLLEQKEQFIALMSHELRTPLNGIIGLSNSLLEDYTVGRAAGCDGKKGPDGAGTLVPAGVPDPEDTARTVALIRNSGARLLNLINDILDAAALRKGTLAVQLARVSLAKVADDVVDLTQPLTKPGVALRNRIGASVPPVLGDMPRLMQVLYNLISNSCKFTERGDIWVDAAVVQGGEMVAVSVHDTGIGIPDSKLEDIFDPFQQVDMSTTRRYGGTGLGLNLAKQLVEAHGGSISVTSTPGKGSVFTFVLHTYQEGSSRRTSKDSAASSLASLTTPARRASIASWPSDDSSMQDDAAAREQQRLLARSAAAALDLAPAAAPPAPGPGGLAALGMGLDPNNVMQRLSIESALRASLDISRNLHHRAPQQLSPKAAAAAFASATSPAVASIQTGRRPSEPAPAPAAPAPAAAPNGGQASSPPERGWLLAGERVREAERQGQIMILSVDDDPVNQMVIQTMLSKSGLKVVKAGDGEKALSLLEGMIEKGAPPDLMLLDVMMPKLSGYDVVRIVRERWPALMLPVIMVSANNREEQVVAGLQAGSNDYVTKPIGQKELIARIEVQLRTKQFTEGVAAAYAAAPA